MSSMDFADTRGRNLAITAFMSFSQSRAGATQGSRLGTENCFQMISKTTNLVSFGFICRGAHSFRLLPLRRSSPVCLGGLGKLLNRPRLCSCQSRNAPKARESKTRRKARRPGGFFVATVQSRQTRHNFRPLKCGFNSQKKPQRSLGEALRPDRCWGVRGYFRSLPLTVKRPECWNLSKWNFAHTSVPKGAGSPQRRTNHPGNAQRRTSRI